MAWPCSGGGRWVACDSGPVSSTVRCTTGSASTLTPLICVTPAADAIAFYESVFGAVTVTRMDGPDGSVLHGELQFEDGRLQVMDPTPHVSVVGADPTSDEVRYSLAVYVPDVDRTVAIAVEHGATLREQVDDFDVTGDRFGSIRDPFGVRWTVMTRTSERTDAQVQEGLDAWAASWETA